MLKQVRKTHNRSKHSFTLVELIVVLVVLAILVAMLVPALTGYIKRSRKAKYMQMVDAYRTAAQSVMAEFYGVTPGHHWPKSVNVSWYDINKDVDDESITMDGKPWGTKVLNLVGADRGKNNHEPYILVIGIGDPREASLSTSEKYSVFYVGYVADEKAPAVFWIDGEFSYTYPTESPQKIRKTGSGNDIRNWIIRDGQDYPIQYFVVSNRTGKNVDQFWLDMSKGLKGHSEPYFKG